MWNLKQKKKEKKVKLIERESRKVAPRGWGGGNTETLIEENKLSCKINKV